MVGWWGGMAWGYWDGGWWGDMVLGVLGWVGGGAVAWLHGSTVAGWHADGVVRWQSGGLRGWQGEEVAGVGGRAMDIRVVGVSGYWWVLGCQWILCQWVGVSQRVTVDDGCSWRGGQVLMSDVSLQGGLRAGGQPWASATA